METQERNTKQRILKIEDKLQKVREESKIMELTNQIVSSNGTTQIDHLMTITSMSASSPMDNNLNGSFGIPRSPSCSQLLSLNDDEIMTLLDDTSFDINVQDPNHPRHNNL
ncbi:hypothetical protein H5410_012592 [Solanum commersonii]|uniref:Uncharacterized protein n=1 Tax=Solanum commersonii TaxID=4109 RepID=A0A9J6AS56_SOLCO|nr:hypothetical protein H5410_012592 [Solanum commersonii]